MRRRQFIAGLAIATFWRVAARAQQSSGQMRQLGILSPGPEVHPPGKRRQAFLDRLRELGWIDGKTIQIHARYAGGVLDRLPELARELVALKVDVIVAPTVPASTGGARGHIDDPHCDGRNRESRRCRVDRESGPARRQRHRH